MSEFPDFKTAKAEVGKLLKKNSELLREVNHRVYDNMQTILSLIILESGEVIDPDCKDFINRLTTKIETIAIIEQIFHNEVNAPYINYGEFVHSFIHSYKHRHHDIHHIQFTTTGDLQIDINTALSIGLIICEIFNILKPLFSHKDIFISFSYSSHDGVLSIKSSSAYGFGNIIQSMLKDEPLRILHLLVKNMSGCIKYENDNSLIEVLLQIKPSSSNVIHGNL